MAQIGGFLDLRSRWPAKDCIDGDMDCVDGEKRLLLDGEIAEADLMRFEWIDTEKEAYDYDCNGNIGKFTTWREKISRILDSRTTRRLLQLLWMPIG